MPKRTFGGGATIISKSTQTETKNENKINWIICFQFFVLFYPTWNPWKNLKDQIFAVVFQNPFYKKRFAFSSYIKN